MVRVHSPPPIKSTTLTTAAFGPVASRDSEWLIYLIVRSANESGRIQDYGVIGDCRAAALVSRYGSLDWLCWPSFDSPSIFAAILDRHKGGHWSISPKQPFRVQRAYIADSNVLETHFEGASGRGILTDLMPVASEDFKRRSLLPDHELLRQIKCTSGELEFEVDFSPRPEYGRKSANLRQQGSHGLRMDVGRGAYHLRSSIPLRVQGGRAQATVVLKSPDVSRFSLTYSEEAPAVLPSLGDDARSRMQFASQFLLKPRVDGQRQP